MKTFAASGRLPVLILACVFLGGCARNPAQREARYLEEGRKHLAAGDFSRATIDFRNAVQVMPKDAEAHYQLAMAYIGSGSTQAGVNELYWTTQLDSKHVGAQLRLAELM